MQTEINGGQFGLHYNYDLHQLHVERDGYKFPSPHVVKFPCLLHIRC